MIDKEERFGTLRFQWGWIVLYRKHLRFKGARHEVYTFTIKRPLLEPENSSLYESWRGLFEAIQLRREAIEKEMNIDS